jgi:hypothetical protein
MVFIGVPYDSGCAGMTSALRAINDGMTSFVMREARSWKAQPEVISSCRRQAAIFFAFSKASSMVPTM